MSTDAAADNPTREGNYMPKGPSVNGHTAQGGEGEFCTTALSPLINSAMTMN